LSIIVVYRNHLKEVDSFRWYIALSWAKKIHHRIISTESSRKLQLFHVQGHIDDQFSFFIDTMSMGSFIFFIIQLRAIQGKCGKFLDTYNIFQCSINRRKTYLMSLFFDHSINIICSIMLFSNELLDKTMIFVPRHCTSNNKDPCHFEDTSPAFTAGKDEKYRAYLDNFYTSHIRSK